MKYYGLLHIEKLTADSGGKKGEISRMISVGSLFRVDDSSPLGRGGELGGAARNPSQKNKFVTKAIATKLNVNGEISHNFE